jgi:hypothetical protein
MIKTYVKSSVESELEYLIIHIFISFHHFIFFLFLFAFQSVQVVVCCGGSGKAHRDWQRPRSSWIRQLEEGAVTSQNRLLRS